jgi:hypothetical protein
MVRETKYTDYDLINLAIELLKPPDDERREECELDVKEGLARVGALLVPHERQRLQQSKAGRKSLTKYLSALKRARDAKKTMDEVIGAEPFKRIDFDPEISRIGGLLKEMDRDKREKGRKKEDNSETRRGPDSSHQRAAVVAAADICSHFGKPLKVGKSSLWPRLSAILLGRPELDVTYLCRKRLAKRRVTGTK